MGLNLFFFIRLSLKVFTIYSRIGSCITPIVHHFYVNHYHEQIAYPKKFFFIQKKKSHKNKHFIKSNACFLLWILLIINRC